MKIVTSTGEFETRTPEGALRYKDLQPGDVFRYRKGAKENVYIHGETGDFHINGSREFNDINVVHRKNTPIILYPDATLVLGREQELKEEAKS